MGFDFLSRQFVAAMSAMSSRGTPEPQTPIVDPQYADHAVAGSSFMAALGDAGPWLAEGPASLVSSQRWIATGAPPWAPSRYPEPVPHRLLEASRDLDPLDGAKVGQIGLFTSTACGNDPGMWRHFLEENQGMGLWPFPWSTWSLTPRHDSRVNSIRTAGDWVDLLHNYPASSRSGIQPDWPAIAADFDAVHFTPHAVCAVEGVRFKTRSGLSAPVYWDVECTRWLRWCFESVDLVRVERE